MKTTRAALHRSILYAVEHDGKGGVALNLMGRTRLALDAKGAAFLARQLTHGGDPVPIPGAIVRSFDSLAGFRLEQKIKDRAARLLEKGTRRILRSSRPGTGRKPS